MNSSLAAASHIAPGSLGLKSEVGGEEGTTGKHGATGGDSRFSLLKEWYGTWNNVNGGGGMNVCLGKARSRAEGVLGKPKSAEGGGSFRKSAICLRIVELRGPLSCWTAETK